MAERGFTLIETIVASSLAALVLVGLLEIRQNCLSQVARAQELTAAGCTARKIVNQWRIPDFSQAPTLALDGHDEGLGISWTCQVQDVQVFPSQWLQSLTIQFYSRSRIPPEPLVEFTAMRYPPGATEGGYGRK